MSAKINIVCAKKEFKNSNEKKIVFDNVNLEINDGEFICILGHSGCGKSTLLRSIAKFEELTSGEIYFNDNILKKPMPSIFMMFQDFEQLFPWKTILGNILYALKVADIEKDKNKAKEIAEFYLESVGLKEYVNEYPHRLSGGMKQRAALARALAINAEVMLMDEPLGSLDAITRSNIQDTILEVWKKYKKTIVFVTHDIDEAIKLSTRIVVLNKKTVDLDIINKLNADIGMDDDEKSDYKEMLKNKITNKLCN